MQYDLEEGAKEVGQSVEEYKAATEKVYRMYVEKYMPDRFKKNQLR